MLSRNHFRLFSCNKFYRAYQISLIQWIEILNWKAINRFSHTLTYSRINCTFLLWKINGTKINWCDVPSWLVHALNSKINILHPILLTLAHKSNCSNDGKSSLCPVCGKPFLFLEGSLKVYKWWWAQRPTFIFFGFFVIKWRLNTNVL